MVRLRISQNTRLYILGAGLGIILFFLGALQYRDNRQLRGLLEQQMRATLQASLMRVRWSIEQQLAPICYALVPSQLNNSRTNLQQYAAEFERWRSTAAYPGLVTNIFFYQGAGARNAALFQLKPGENEFKPAEWPQNFAQLHEVLDQSLRSFDRSRTGNALVPHHDPSNVPSFGWFVDEDTPALIHPTVDSENPGHLSFLVVQLSLQELGQHVLPELVQRDLNSGGKLNYQAALVSRDGTNEVIYTSDPGFGTQNSSLPDVELNVFGPPMIVSGKQRAVGARENPGADVPPDFSAFDLSGSHNDHGDSGRLMMKHSPERPGRPSARPQGYESHPLRLDPIRQRPCWTLIAQHRQGSVEAAAALLYHHNLAIGFGVLLVLAGTIATMIFSVKRAQQLAQARMDFVTNVSHELRTPLTGIVSAAQNIADGLIEEKDKAMRYGAAIVGQAQQLSELIEQILLFSATEKGRHVYHFDWVNISEAVQAAINGCTSAIRTSRVQVEQNIDPDLPEVWGDFRALTQCLQNLVMNAIKYGGESRWVGVRASLTEPGPGSKEVKITVEDKGIGISKGDLRQIFEPFYRSSAVTSAQIHGSGLGLSIARSIAQAMGGDLTAESELGKGSKFSVHLPASRKMTQTELESARAMVEAADKS